METLLCLPFFLLFLVLVVDLGYGQVVRIKTQGAVRFAGTSYMRSPDGADRKQYAEDQLRSFYNDLDITDIFFKEGPRSPFRTKRRATHLVARVAPPFGTILSPTETSASFYALKHRVWEYDRVPLAVGPLLDKVQDPRLADYIGYGPATVLRVGASILEVFAEYLGMKP